MLGYLNIQCQYMLECYKCLHARVRTATVDVASGMDMSAYVVEECSTCIR